jgi:hypothetical protein
MDHDHPFFLLFMIIVFGALSRMVYAKYVEGNTRKVQILYIAGNILFIIIAVVLILLFKR